MKFRLVVTKGDLAKGQRVSSLNDPVARALTRKFRNKYISVGYNHIVIGSENYRTPGSLRWFITRWDNGDIGTEQLPIRNYSFTLDLEKLKI